jgi:DNA-binding Lrp family transcriptional regulator
LHLDFENFIRVSQREIADALGRRRERTSRSIQKLSAMGVIIAGPKLGRSAI